MFLRSSVSFGLLYLLLMSRPVWASTDQNSDQDEFNWLLGYRDKGENALALDPRFSPFLLARLPTVPLPPWNNQPVNKAAISFLRGVPEDIRAEHNRFFTASGCPAHACVVRALLWVDAQQRSVYFICTGDEKPNEAPATRDQYHILSAKLYIATKGSMTGDELPDELRGAIIRWLHIQGVLSLSGVTLLTSSGTHPSSTDELCWSGRCSTTDWFY